MTNSLNHTAGPEKQWQWVDCDPVDCSHGTHVCLLWNSCRGKKEIRHCSYVDIEGYAPTLFVLPELFVAGLCRFRVGKISLVEGKWCSRSDGNSLIRDRIRRSRKPQIVDKALRFPYLRLANNHLLKLRQVAFRDPRPWRKTPQEGGHNSWDKYLANYQSSGSLTALQVIVNVLNVL